MANETNLQYHGEFEQALNNLERSAIAAALQTTTWILHKIDGQVLEYLLDDCQDEVISILKAASQMNQGVPNMIVVENARLALIGLANEKSAIAENNRKVEAMTEFMRRQYSLIVTNRRKGKIFFRLNVAGMTIDAWMDFGSKTYLHDWEYEAITENINGQNIGTISRSELIGLRDSGVQLSPDLNALTEERLK